MTSRAEGLSVSTLWTEARDPIGVVVIAHGAGASMRHPFMGGIAETMAAQGLDVLRFNFPYIDAGRRMPDAPTVLLATWDAMIQEALDRRPELPLVVGGKSMGGRMVSMLAAARGAEFPARALVFFGYPLHAAGRPDRPRDAHLPRIRHPMVFIQGSEDPLARLDLMEALVRRLEPLAQLQVIAGANHSFRCRGARDSDYENGRRAAEIAVAAVRAIVAPAAPSRPP